MESVVTIASASRPAVSVSKEAASRATPRWLIPSVATKSANAGVIWGKVKVALLVVLIGYGIAAVYYYWQAVYLGRGYPYNTFLSIPQDRFTDYDNMILMTQNLNPYHDHSRSGYPPFANLFFYMFSRLSLKEGLAVFILLPCVILLRVVYQHLWRLERSVRVLAALFLFLFSYPWLVAVDRGNLEMWIAMALALFFLNYESREPWRRDLACCGLAAAIAFKIYPLPLLLLPLKDRRFGDCAKVAGVALLLTLGAAGLFKGGPVLAIHDFQAMIAQTGDTVKNTIRYGVANVGLYYAGVIVLTKLSWSTAWFGAHYWLFAVGFLVIYGTIIAFSRLSVWATGSSLVILACLVPSLSNDYRMAQLLIPFLLFLTSHTSAKRAYLIITALFALLLVPKNYLLLFPHVPPGDVGIASVINPIILIGLLNVILITENKTYRHNPVRACYETMRYTWRRCGQAAFSKP